MTCHGQVSLPPKTKKMAPGIFNEGTPGPRYFDFSAAPDVEGFNFSSCPTEMTWRDTDAFKVYGEVSPRSLESDPTAYCFNGT